MHSPTMSPWPVCAAAILMLPAATLADGTYQFAIDTQASSLNSAVSVNAPTTGTLLGNYDAATNPTGTRTKPGFFGSFGETENVPVPVTVEVAITGNNTTNPSGTFVLRLNTDAAEAGLSALNLNLLGTDAPVIDVTANVNWDTFRTRNPTCLVIGGFTIPLPLGQATISTLTAVQGAGESVGALVPAGSDTFTVAIPVTVELAFGAAFLGQEIPPTPQSVPLVFAATVTLDGNGGATIAASLDGFEITQEQAGPIGDPFDLPFTEPLCQGNLIFTLQLQSLSATSSAEASLVAIGTKQVPVCPCDWDANGTVAVPDIFAFLASWFALDPQADFDGAGGVGAPDIFAFLSCWFSRPGGCI